MTLEHDTEIEQELLLHSLLHQSLLFDKYKKKLALEEEEPKETIIHNNFQLLTESESIVPDIFDSGWNIDRFKIITVLK